MVDNYSELKLASTAKVEIRSDLSKVMKQSTSSRYKVNAYDVLVRLMSTTDSTRRRVLLHLSRIKKKNSYYCQHNLTQVKIAYLNKYNLTNGCIGLSFMRVSIVCRK